MSDASTTIRVERDSSGAGRITLTRSDKRNAVNAEMAEEIAAAVAGFEQDSVRVASLHAEGPAFCAGADMSDLHTAAAAVQSVLRSLTTGTIHWTIVVAGAARGAALGMLAAVPRVLATPEASFALPEVARGFFPSDLIAGQIDALGAKAAFDLALSGAPVDAVRAQQLGMVTAVGSAAELEEQLQAMSAYLLTLPEEGFTEGLRHWSARARAQIDARITS